MFQLTSVRQNIFMIHANQLKLSLQHYISYVYNSTCGNKVRSSFGNRQEEESRLLEANSLLDDLRKQ